MAREINILNKIEMINIGAFDYVKKSQNSLTD